MTAQFGPHRWSPSPHTAAHTDAYRGAEVAVRDLRGARVVDSDLTGARIVDSTLVDVEPVGVRRTPAGQRDRRHRVRRGRARPPAPRARAAARGAGRRRVPRRVADRRAAVGRRRGAGRAAARGRALGAGRRRVVVRRDAAAPGVHHRLVGEPHGARRGAAVPPAGPAADRLRPGRRRRPRHAGSPPTPRGTRCSRRAPAASRWCATCSPT
nr:hypothetical protein [Angustibacter aerolatus]